MSRETAVRTTGERRARRGSRTRSPLRVGIVGAGKMGMAHARVVGRGGAPAEVIAVVDPAEERRAEFRAAAREATGFTTLSEMLDGRSVDVVHVCTPPDSHAPVAREALEAGCHVYVEKPFVPTRTEARELIELARERSLMLCPGHQLLEAPAVHRFRELSPAVGRPVHVESYFSFNPVRRGPDGRAPLREDLQLLDVLPHPVYLLLRALRLGDPDGTIELESVRVGRKGTLHAIVRSGELRGTLIVTLGGRPVENYLRMVGEGGTVHADLVRDTVQSLLGPGTSTLSKAFGPFRLARQIAAGTAAALARRALHRDLSYPGLRELVGGFHSAIREGGDSPVSDEELLATVGLCERVAEEIRGTTSVPQKGAHNSRERVCVTGGTGFLGRALVRQLLESGKAPVVLARRLPAPWDRIEGVEYSEVDLGGHRPTDLVRGSTAVVHCAAATSGGFEVHERNSVRATENLLRGMAEAGVARLIHVSSLAVLDRDPETGGLSDRSSVLDDSRAAGPYAWGKARSERVARSLSEKLGVEFRIVRPGPIIDERRLEPPGRLGRLLGDRLFVLVGGLSEPIPTISVAELARLITRMLDGFEQAPSEVNLIDEPPRTRGDLADDLRRSNPDLRVIRLPRWAFEPLAAAANGAARLLRPSLPDLRRAFASEPMHFERPAFLLVEESSGRAAAPHGP